MPLEVRSVPRPDWAPLPRDGCRGVEVKVLLEDDHLLVAMLRFRPGETIDEIRRTSTATSSAWTDGA
jgi:hypothetical protein